MRHDRQNSLRYLVLDGTAREHPFLSFVERYPGPVLLALLLVAGLMTTYLGN